MQPTVVKVPEWGDYRSLSILYLRCTQQLRGIMPIDYVAELSILYLRCVLARRGLLRGGKSLLSILYLRC